MRIKLPRSEYPVVRLIVDLPDGGRITGDYVGDCFDDVDVPLPRGVDADAVRVYAKFLDERRESKGSAVLKEPAEQPPAEQPDVFVTLGGDVGKTAIAIKAAVERPSKRPSNTHQRYTKTPRGPRSERHRSLGLAPESPARAPLRPRTGSPWDTHYSMNSS